MSLADHRTRDGAVTTLPVPSTELGKAAQLGGQGPNAPRVWRV